MEIDVFDFDGTIYDGDSTADFIRYAIVRHPSLLPGLAAGLLKAAWSGLRGKLNLSAFKGFLFSAMAGHIDLEQEAECFWKEEKTRARIGAWFLSRERDLPVIIASASPDFELKPAAALLGADLLVCTRCDARTGRIIGSNCKSAEKIRRIGEALGDYRVRSMYTDNAKADGPLLEIAQEKYIVTHGVVRRVG